MGSLIHFLINHNEKIIAVVGGAILFLSVVVVWWQVFGKKGLKTEATSDFDLSAIEDSLKKILAQTNVAIGQVAADHAVAVGAESTPGAVGEGESARAGQTKSVGSAGGITASGVSPASAAELEALKKELEQRAKIIQDLSAQVESVKTQDASSELLAKIKNLEGKLAEYEVIEDDIADLSLYKEENAKLKKELEQLKRASPQMVDQFAEAMAEAEQGTEPVASSPGASAEPEQVEPEGPSTEPPLEQELSPAASTGPSPEPSPESPSVTEAAPPAQEPAVATAESNPVPEAKGDIFGEFSEGAGGQEEDPLAALGDIDPDRMLDELKDLNADLDVGIEAVQESPDIDKMAEEAVTLADKKG